MFKLVLGEARTYFVETRRNSKLLHVVLPLRGRFKGKTDETFHFAVLTAKSNSGLEIRPWVERGISSREEMGITQGYFFTNFTGG